MSDHLHLPQSGVTIPVAEDSPSIAKLIEAKVVSSSELREALEQVEFFVNQWAAISSEYPGKYIIVSEAKIFPGATYDEALSFCRRVSQKPYFAAGFMPYPVSRAGGVPAASSR